MTARKVWAAEEGWTGRDSEHVALARGVSEYLLHSK